MLWFPRSKSDCIRLLIFNLYLMLLIINDCEVYALDKKYQVKQKRKRGNRGRKTSDDINLSSGFWIIGILIFSITIPTLLYFLYSVLQDPITPSVLKNAWDVAKLKYFGYLSSLKKKTGVSFSTSADTKVENDVPTQSDSFNEPDLEGDSIHQNMLHKM